MFKDVQLECLQLKSGSNKERALELRVRTEGASIVAVGGFPIVYTNDQYNWCNTPVTPGILKEHILSGVGLSGMLAHTNKSKMSLQDLGNKCVRLQHNWAYNWMTVSVMLSGFGREVEYAFTRDTRFFMSWPVDTEMGLTCTANGTIKSWIKFIKNKDNPDFPEEVRKAMYDVHTLLKEILP